MTVDRSKPTTGTPRVLLRSATNLYAESLRIAIEGAGSDVGPAGIGTFDVARSEDGKAFASMGSFAAGSEFHPVLTPGHTYRFEIRAHDRAGNVGSWVAGPTLHPALTQQTSTSIRWTGTTNTASSSSYSGGSVRFLPSTGATATYTTTARALSFVTTTGPARGSAEIWIDGVDVGRVDLSALTTTYRAVVFSKTWSSVGTHTIRIVARSSSRVDVDAFGVIR
jgi:hypothetical protein